MNFASISNWKDRITNIRALPNAKERQAFSIGSEGGISLLRDNIYFLSHLPPQLTSRPSSAQLAALREDASCARDGESRSPAAHQATNWFYFSIFPTKIQLWDGFLVKTATDIPLLSLAMKDY